MDKIIEALKQLDTNNDEHWTADGAPRMDEIERIAGEKYTRDQVKAAAPKFNRATLDLTANEEAQDNPEAPINPWDQANQDKPEMTGDGEQVNPADHNVVSDPAKVKVQGVTDERRAEVDANLAKAQSDFEKARLALEEATAEKDAIIMLEAQVENKVNQASDIKRFQQQQHEQRQARVQQSQLLAQLVAGKQAK